MISTAAAPTLGLSSAATLGIAAGAFAAEELLKHMIGQGRRAADKWVQSGSGQNAFLKNVLEPAQKLMEQDPEKARAYMDQAWRNYLASANEYASKGSNQSKVIQQNLTTPAFMNTVGTLLGKDPLAGEYTDSFMGMGKVGNVLTRGGSAVVNGLGKVIAAIKTPTVHGTPPYVPGTSGKTTGSPTATTPATSGKAGAWGQLAAEVGGGIGASLLGSVLGKVRPTDQEKQVIANDLAAQKLGMQTSQNLLGIGTQALEPALRYQSSILSGDRSKVTSALAPDIQRIGQGYRAATEASASLNPRGGPTAAFNAELPFQQQRDVSTLMQTARPQAANTLLGAGTNLVGTGVNALYGSTSAGRDVLTQQAQARQIEAERGKSIGAGLFETFQKYGMPALQKQWPNIFGGA